MTDLTPTPNPLAPLSPAQSRAVDIALRAGRYRTERDMLRNDLAQADREREVIRQDREQLREQFGRTVAHLEARERTLEERIEQLRRLLDEILTGEPDLRCEELDSCLCPVARSWRVLQGLPEWVRS